LWVARLFALAATVASDRGRSRQAVEFFFDNPMMGAHLLDKAWRTGVPKFVVIGTVCASPKVSPVLFNEEELWNGHPEETNALCGLAKEMSLVRSQAYRQQYGYNSIFLLSVNLYGPDDNFDSATSHVIPSLIRESVEAVERWDEEVALWGDGTPTRDCL
jgi:GDP-L-fucose synthase